MRLLMRVYGSHCSGEFLSLVARGLLSTITPVMKFSLQLPLTAHPSLLILSADKKSQPARRCRDQAKSPHKGSYKSEDPCSKCYGTYVSQCDDDAMLGHLVNLNQEGGCTRARQYIKRPKPRE